MGFNPGKPQVPSNEVRRFLRPAGGVSVHELKELQPSIDAILHVSRHLRELNQAAENRLVGQTTAAGKLIDHDFIRGLLDAAGSKFNAKIDDPEKVIAWCLEKFRSSLETRKLEWYENPITGELTSSLLFIANKKDKTYFGLLPEERIGCMAVVDITPEIADMVVRETRGSSDPRDNVTINVVHGLQAPETDQIFALIKRISPGVALDFYTAYSGIETPSLPRPSEQSPEEVLYNREWWAKRAFLIEGKA